MIAAIARREFSERLRSRLFLGINAFLMIAIIAGIALPELIDGRPDAFRLGVADDDSAAVANVAVSQSAVHGIDFDVSAVDDRRSGEAELEDGALDAVLVDGTTLLVGSSVSAGVEFALSSAAQSVQLDSALDRAGIPPDERAELLAGQPLSIEPLGDDPGVVPFGPAMIIVLVAIGILYGLLIFHGQWVAQGIVEEKQSRIVEVLLSAVRPHQLLGGKIVGLGALGLAQIVLLALVALGTMAVVGTVDIPEEVRGAIVLVVAWYILGFALYATLFAASGAIAARTEDLQATTTPVIVLLIVAILVAQAALAAPRTVTATVAAYVPFTAPLVQPVRYASEASSLLEGVVAALITLGTIVILVPLTSRLYRGGVLKTRSRVSLREAWSSSDRG